ncbi:EAL domain-containing protein [Leptospira stimsonii]|uniref:EAL domain-containing protein n=1 Tax=Leptospira stimsonii TaxID=2202203 RepID=A0A4R9LCQ6_9LEPT|nr:EAL domain-containing protein [Leptospira stimsonii]RHX84200.1 EAL domain-containing protein [Leptospira stimsonii]TGK26046.1 EAL domain-containing protein [Leptospira stimsonii]TGM22479.1 EAL domain-containing protein [Leptospira stimsonii]
MLSRFQDVPLDRDLDSRTYSYALYNFGGDLLYSDIEYESLLKSDSKLSRTIERFLEYGNIYAHGVGIRKVRADRRIRLVVRSALDRVYKINFETNAKSKVVFVHIESTTQASINSEKHRVQRFRSLRNGLLRSLKLQSTYFYLVNIEIYNHPFLHQFENKIYEAVFLDLHAEFLTITNSQNLGFRVSANQIFFSYQINKPDVDINWIPSSLISYMKNTIQVEGHEFHLKLSIGGYHTAELDATPLQILRGLRSNLNQVIEYPFSRYATESQNDSSQMIATYLSLRNSVHKKELFLHYQPILSAETRALHSLEALSRWNQTEKGMISPDIFIPLAEESGLISSIGSWVIRNAFRDFMELKRRCTSSDFICSINISPFQLKNPEFADNLIFYFSNLSLSPSSVILEITESRYEETPLIIEQMSILKKFGFQIAIDDFGVGNSNFSRIEKIESDYVKLDKSLILGTDSNLSKRSVLKAISQVLLSLGKKTVFEGIENSTLEKIAIDCGANYLQGFLYGKPSNLYDLPFLTLTGGPK